MKELMKDYLNFYNKDVFDKDGNRLCKNPFTYWMITGTTVGILTTLIMM